MTYKGSFTDSWVRISVLVSKGRYFSLNTISVVLSLFRFLHSQLYSNLCSGVSVIFTYWTMELNWIISVKLLCFLYHFIEVTSPQRAKGCPGTFWLWADVRGSVTSSIGAPVGETTYPTPPSMVLRLLILGIRSWYYALSSAQSSWANFYYAWMGMLILSSAKGASFHTLILRWATMG